MSKTQNKVHRKEKIRWLLTHKSWKAGSVILLQQSMEDLLQNASKSAMLELNLTNWLLHERLAYAVATSCVIFL